MYLRHSVGQPDAAFVEVGIALGLGQLGRFGIGMRPRSVAVQVVELLLHGAVSRTVVLRRRGAILRSDSDDGRKQESEPRIHRRAASVAGGVTASTCGFSMVPEITYDLPARSSLTSSLPSEEAVPATTYFAPPDCSLQSLSVNVPS